jgi:hypothetical protein
VGVLPSHCEIVVGGLEDFATSEPSQVVSEEEVDISSDSNAMLPAATAVNTSHAFVGQ